MDSFAVWKYFKELTIPNVFLIGLQVDLIIPLRLRRDQKEGDQSCNLNGNDETILSPETYVFAMEFIWYSSVFNLICIFIPFYCIARAAYFTAAGTISPIMQRNAILGALKETF